MTAAVSAMIAATSKMKLRPVVNELTVICRT